MAIADGISTKLVMPCLKMMPAKGFLWEPTGLRRWRLEICSTGQGISHCNEFFQILAESHFHGLISYQLEYGIAGFSKGSGIALSRDKVPTVMADIKENLDYIKTVIREAYEGAWQVLKE